MGEDFIRQCMRAMVALRQLHRICFDSSFTAKAQVEKFQ
jgi:hypothetical protein